MDEQAVRGLLGLAMRAGQLVLGTGRVVDMLRAGEDLAVLVDEHAAQNTQKRLADTCTSYNRPLCRVPAALLESALGRSGVMVVALKQGGIREKILTACCVDNN